MSQIVTPLTLYTSILEVNEYAYWNDADGAGDPWVGQAYQWEVRFTCTSQLTGNFENSYYYTSRDVKVGDWILMGSSTPALSVKIVSIVNIDNSDVVTAIVEDVDRYNLHLTGIGGGAIGGTSAAGVTDALIFRLGDDGLPMLAALSDATFTPMFYQEVNSRFLFRNYAQNNYPVSQPGHTFVAGDEIALNSDGTYSLASAQGLGAFKAVGFIKDVGIPGPDWFTFEPKGKLIRYISTALPGNPGDILYLDPDSPGKLTTTRPTIGVAVPVFIKINDNTGIKLSETIVGGLDNFAATTGPTVNDDSADGYGWGSLWVDRSTQQAWINVDPTVDAAVWQLIGSGTGPGAMGPTGPAGPAGIDGSTGPQGEMGPTGAAGIDGSTGPTGSAGTAGIDGATGPQGTAGIDGVTGPQGDIGATGPQGTAGIDGATGPQGDIGATGAAGTSVTIVGSVVTAASLPTPYTGNIGDGYIVEDTGHLHVWTGSSWNDVGEIKGQQGEIGPTGPQGIAGIDGVTGPQGTAGIDGATGAQGDIGATGPQGIAGIDGVTGPQGTAGIDGVTGAQGDTGPTGEMGPTGSAGTSVVILGSVNTYNDLPGYPSSYTGSNGDGYITSIDPAGHLWVWEGIAWVNAGLIQGPQGLQGDTGPTGADSTVTGPTGVAGIDGATGPTGVAGIDGATGPTGADSTVTGPQGSTGPQGVMASQDLQFNNYIADGTSNVYTLSREPLNAANMVVSVGGLVQTPYINYTVAGYELTFTYMPVAYSEITAIQLNAGAGPTGPVGMIGTGSPGPTGPVNTGSILISTLKALVADSADFAEFRSKLASL